MYKNHFIYYQKCIEIFYALYLSRYLTTSQLFTDSTLYSGDSKKYYSLNSPDAVYGFIGF